ncbi:MAG TPA: catalase [Polyangiaceae bacterium]|nr:catalase [Polyangiaceae bacterium]
MNRAADSRSGAGENDSPHDDALAPERLQELVRHVERQQARVAQAEFQGCPRRGQHEKPLLAAFGTLTISPSRPSETRFGAFAEAGRFKVAVRFSNGQPNTHPDTEPDVRGVALKFFTHAGEETDLLATNEGGRSHAPNVTQFVEFADALVEQALRGIGAFFAALSRLVWKRRLGFVAAAEMFGVLLVETIWRHPQSLIFERYWGSVTKLGPSTIKYSIQPHSSSSRGRGRRRKSKDYLRDDLIARLKDGPVRFDVCVQFFISEELTPVHDASIAWRAPLVCIGELELPSVPPREDESAIETFAFNPCNGFEALGITQARCAIYRASARERNAAQSDEIRRHWSE